MMKKIEKKIKIPPQGNHGMYYKSPEEIEFLSIITKLEKEALAIQRKKANRSTKKKSKGNAKKKSNTLFK